MVCTYESLQHFSDFMMEEVTVYKHSNVTKAFTTNMQLDPIKCNKIS